MSLPDRGKLFEYAQKPKPSSPDFHGDCTIDDVAYELRGYHRDEQLALHLAPPKGDSNKIPMDVFKGALDPAPPKPPRSKKDKAPPVDEEPTPAWSGIIVSEESAYMVRAFEKQGKSGRYWTLSFEKTEKPAKEEEWETSSDVTEEA